MQMPAIVTARRGEREAESASMRYDRLKDIVRLAVRLQAASGGLALEDIQADFSVSRSTAERMRDAVGEVFGQLERVDTSDAKHHWRLRSDAVRRLVAIAPEELAELESAASALERAGIEERATTLREFAKKVHATLRTESLHRIESELEALVQAEGLAMRAGPRPRLDAGLVSAMREAITVCYPTWKTEAHPIIARTSASGHVQCSASEQIVTDQFHITRVRRVIQHWSRTSSPDPHPPPNTVSLGVRQ